MARQTYGAVHRCRKTYGHRGRMVSKRITENDGSNSPFSVLHSTFVWDDWNIIREIVREGGSVTVTDNVWGLDIDGSLQGAGGVGGLLAVVRSDCAVTNSAFCIQHSALYLPTYDANGNVSEYVSTNGEIVAHYDYSPFGEILVQSGDLADTFTHRFSTKPWCPITGLYEYQMRKYKPEIGRWLSRDPIDDKYIINPYNILRNNTMSSTDYCGMNWQGTLTGSGGHYTLSYSTKTQNPLWYLLGSIDFSIKGEVKLSPNGNDEQDCTPNKYNPIQIPIYDISFSFLPPGISVGLYAKLGNRAALNSDIVAKEYILVTTFENYVSYKEDTRVWSDKYCKCYDSHMSANIESFSVVNNAGLAFLVLLLRNPQAVYLLGASLIQNLSPLPWGEGMAIPGFR